MVRPNPPPPSSVPIHPWAHSFSRYGTHTHLFWRPPPLMANMWRSGASWLYVTFATSVVVSTLQTPLYWKRLCVGHASAGVGGMLRGRRALVSRRTTVPLAAIKYFSAALGVSHTEDSLFKR